MKATMTKTLLQATAVLFAGILLLGCPSDENDPVSGDVTVVNDTGFTLDVVTINKTGTGGTNLGPLLDQTSATYTGYDCTISLINHVGGDNGVLVTGDFTFTPSCGGTTTITWQSGGLS